MNPSFRELDIRGAREALRAGDVSATDLAEYALEVIKEKDERVHAYLEVYDDVLDQAKEADRKIASGANAPLLGIPIAIKDNILVAGRYMTAGSKILEGYRAPYDATAITKLTDAGAVLLGRTNLDEFAMGSSTEHSAYTVTSNPLALERVPGGSSGGSAAAVALGGALGSLGSDTGGSIRQPAAFCGVVGFKPTYGTVSRFGLVAMGSSLDQIGPIGKTVTDTEILFTAISGFDPHDSTSLPEAAPAGGQVTTVGVPRAFLEKGIDADVLESFEGDLTRLRELGYKVVDVDLPHLKHSLAVYYILMPAEASTNLARFDGVKYGPREEGDTLLDEYMQTRGERFGPEVRKRILLGTYVLSAGYYDAYYTKAEAVRRCIMADFNTAFSTVDVIATPTTPAPAWKKGEKNDDPLAMYLADIFTVPANLTGMPALSIPSGTVSREGVSLPVGLQLMAGHRQEGALFSLGKHFKGEA